MSGAAITAGVAAPAPSLRRASSRRRVTPPTTDSARRSFAAWGASVPRPGASELAIGIAATLLCAGFWTGFVLSSWSARFAVLLALAFPGMVALAVLALRRDRAALAGVAFLVWAAISGITSANPRVALIGQLGKDSSVLILAGTIGVWAIGRMLTATGVRVVQAGLLTGLGLHALLALVQVVSRSNSPELGLAYGRARGLTPNAVFLGALMVGAAGLCTVHALRSGRPSVRWLLAIAAFSAAANFSGSRIALGALTLVVLGTVVARRSLWGVLVMAAVLAGVFGGQLLARGTESGTTRATDVANLDTDGRSTVWQLAADAVREQPLFGVGAGRFRTAVQSDFDAEFVRTAAPNEQTQAWFDAHNVIIEFAVTTGVPGCVLLCAFVVLALRRARGPMLALFVGIALTWLLEPVSVTTGPVALLALGAACAGHVPVPSGRRAVSIVTRVAVVAGLCAGVWYATSDARLDAALASSELTRIEDAAAWLPPDAVVADSIAQAAAIAYRDGVITEAELVAHRERSARLEPDRPLWWVQLGVVHLELGNLDRARAALDRAVELQPWHPTAWRLLHQVAVTTDDETLEKDALAKFCTLAPTSPMCVVPWYAPR